MEKLSRLKTLNRTLLLQLLVTALAFAALTAVSFWVLNSAVRGNLRNHADSVLVSAEERIASTLSEFETALDGFAEQTQNLLAQGKGEPELQAYLEDISRFVFLDGKQLSGIQDFYGYFTALPGGPKLLHGSRIAQLPERPEDEGWYRAALDSAGQIVQTPPRITAGGQTRYTYAKTVSDGQGRVLGVVCMDVEMSMLGQSVVDTALAQDGYGILVSQEGLTLFHPHTEFRGLSVGDPALPFSAYYDEFMAGQDIAERPIVTYNGEQAVAYFRRLPNGWYLGLVTARQKFYQSLNTARLYLLPVAAFFTLLLMGFLIRLDWARSKSDEVSRQKSMFLATMSHEIRTPINAIVGMTAIGRASGVSEYKDYCFSKIDAASKHLMGVISDILDISKIEANKIELSPTDFNFERMLQQVVTVTTFRIDEKHQRFTVYIDKSIPEVLYADDQRLAQVITNLLSNAVKFTPEEGSIHLSAELLGEADGVYTLRVRVKDSGIGISPEQQAKLFRSFQQAEASTTRKYGGTGLGLAISKNLVELMGGTIGVESELGQGSTFSFTAQVRRGDDTKYGLARQRVKLENLRLLTVDDDPVILEYFQGIVREMGAECDVAPGGEQALQLVEEGGDYNIYFVDLKMPGIDGIELTREIRARETVPGTSVVIMISSADLSTVESEARQAGVDRFLLKPIFPSAISETIKLCVGIVNEKLEENAPDNRGVFAGKRILVAEDVEINYEIVLTLLEPTGAELVCAANGAEAVSMFAKDPDAYDLIFMDVQMPEMDGYEATKRIRAMSSAWAKNVPIVAMTANVFKEDVAKCRASGMNDHLGKPLSPEDLLKIAKQYLTDAAPKHTKGDRP